MLWASRRQGLFFLIFSFCLLPSIRFFVSLLQYFLLYLLLCILTAFFLLYSFIYLSSLSICLSLPHYLFVYFSVPPLFSSLSLKYFFVFFCLSFPLCFIVPLPLYRSFLSHCICLLIPLAIFISSLTSSFAWLLLYVLCCCLFRPSFQTCHMPARQTCNIL